MALVRTYWEALVLSPLQVVETISIRVTWKSASWVEGWFEECPFVFASVLAELFATEVRKKLP